jgi:hypothetical protein
MLVVAVAVSRARADRRRGRCRGVHRWRRHARRCGCRHSLRRRRRDRSCRGRRRRSRGRDRRHRRGRRRCRRRRGSSRRRLPRCRGLTRSGRNGHARARGGLLQDDCHRRPQRGAGSPQDVRRPKRRVGNEHRRPCEMQARWSRPRRNLRRRRHDGALPQQSRACQAKYERDNSCDANHVSLSIPSSADANRPPAASARRSGPAASRSARRDQ